MTAPSKPFDTYKWRWLSVQPSEGLLEAPVFFGVLRALLHNEGDPYSSIQLHEELQRVTQETHTNINLARTPERNLFRNSGQYWRGTGLVESATGEIRLTNLGRSVAGGDITNDEFAALMIRNTVLPNPQTYNSTELEKWRNAELRIKPFEIILGLMDKLGRGFGVEQAFLSPNELIRVVIPLTGEKAPVEDIALRVNEFRNGKLDVSSWPDCAPAANDKRLAREFLLFLFNFGICQIGEANDNYDQKFSLDQVLIDEMPFEDNLSFLELAEKVDEEIAISRNSEIPIIIERKRVATSVIRRSNQSRFRRDVLAAADAKCILTSEGTVEVLEAAHIIPVGHGGTDVVGNGFCMRVDIHRLFDGGKIRISPNGSVSLNEHIKEAVSYSALPTNILFPDAVAVENVEWRSRYL
jgi:hypothetical protein